jgi:hypothetical protein
VSLSIAPTRAMVIVPPSHLSRVSLQLLAAENDEILDAASCQHTMVSTMQKPMVQGVVVSISVLAATLGGLAALPCYQLLIGGALIFALTASKFVLLVLIALASTLALGNSILLSPAQLINDLEMLNRSWLNAAVVAICAGVWLGAQSSAQLRLRTKFLVAGVAGAQLLLATLIMNWRLFPTRLSCDTSTCLLLLPLKCYLFAFFPPFIVMQCCVVVTELFGHRRALLMQVEEARRLDLESSARSRFSSPRSTEPDDMPDDAARWAVGDTAPPSADTNTVEPLNSTDGDAASERLGTAFSLAFPEAFDTASSKSGTTPSVVSSDDFLLSNPWNQAPALGTHFPRFVFPNATGNGADAGNSRGQEGMSLLDTLCPPSYLADAGARLAERHSSRMWKKIRVIILGLDSPGSPFSALGMDMIRQIAWYAVHNELPVAAAASPQAPWAGFILKVKLK